MLTRRNIKHDLYLNFHLHLLQMQVNDSPQLDSGGFNGNQMKWVKWFLVLCLVGVAVVKFSFK